MSTMWPSHGASNLSKQRNKETKSLGENSCNKSAWIKAWLLISKVSLLWTYWLPKKKSISICQIFEICFYSPQVKFWLICIFEGNLDHFLVIKSQFLCKHLPFTWQGTTSNTQSWSLNSHLLFLIAFMANGASWTLYIYTLLTTLHKLAIFTLISKISRHVWANFYVNIEKLLCFIDY